MRDPVALCVCVCVFVETKEQLQKQRNVYQPGRRNKERARESEEMER